MNIFQSNKHFVFSLITISMMYTFTTQAYAQTNATNISVNPEAEIKARGNRHLEGHDDGHDDDSDEHHHDETETILVTSTRIGRSINSEPIRIEVINREELEEKAIMRPGNISMLVAETGGVRVQTTSPALGSANIRLQGLYGRYTQLLSDGLPLFGGQASSIGLLQIPPTDLSRVEIIKGSASSLYGGSAMGGVINLISRKPSREAQGEVLLNATSQDGQDITSYLATPLNDSVGMSFTAGAHQQSNKDLDDDGWIDMAGYERYTARPRLFWDGENGASIYATAGFMTENRKGGTRARQTLPDGSTFVHNQDSERFDAGLIANTPLGDVLSLNLRASAMLQNHDKRFGDVLDDDSHESYLLESSLAGYTQNVQWVLGVAMQSDRFESQDFPSFDYSYDVPGIFAQADYELNERISASLSGRFDDHSEFGAQFSPRISMLYRPDDWTIRASYGRGYFAPSPFVEAIEAAGLSRLEPLSNIEEETAVTSSIDIGYQLDKLETNLTFFTSSVEGVTQLEAFSSQIGGPLDRVRLNNAPGESRIYGSELLLRYKWQDYKLTASYLYLDATEFNGSSETRQRVELTPQHSAGFVAMKEQHGKFRIGFEAYYTGIQRLEGNPYRAESKPYWHLGLMGEITTGQFSWFINMENLLNIRQTKEDPLVLPNRAPDGQWTTDIWSRNDGFIVNGGVRVRF
ncbi:iron complex outermembrane recepter protein [Glaciecola punicea ACAM 611]|uniref:Iron complex outermembrane recepter protein n=1 Tax=Glaciecola punicea ACAM 611 TaxID=1121923 RepID=H5TFD4_9ALTE|nr:TonB-dependent receptor [Glaciecola punicea]GAB56814.1 iron complex outermembrane recepter protein [Glaciecola punicea ACAM 611]